MSKTLHHLVQWRQALGRLHITIGMMVQDFDRGDYANMDASGQIMVETIQEMSHHIQEAIDAAKQV